MYALLVVALVIACALRFYSLGGSEFQGDEAEVTSRSVLLVKAVDNFKNLGVLVVHIHPPMELVAPIIPIALLGVNEFAARLSFALAGVLTVVASYLVAKELFGEKAGVFTAFLVACYGPNVMLSRTVQWQIFEALWTTLTALLLAKAINNQQRRQGFLIAAAMCLGLALLTQLDAIFMAPAVAYVIVKLSRGIGLASFLRTSWRAVAVFAALTIPFYAAYASAPLVFPEYIPETLGIRYLTTSRSYALNLYITYYLLELCNNCSAAYLGLVSLGFLAMLSTKSDADKRVFIALWAAPYVLFYSFLACFPGLDYTVTTMMPVLVGAGAGLATVYHKLSKSKLVAYVFISLVVASIALACVHTYLYSICLRPYRRAPPPENPFITFFPVMGYYYYPYKEGWKAAGWYVRENSSLEDLYVSDGEVFVTRYYFDRNYPVIDGIHLCHEGLERFAEVSNRPELQQVRFFVLSTRCRDKYPGVWEYANQRLHLEAVVYLGEKPTIYIYGKKEVAQPAMVRAEVADKWFDQKYGRSPWTILHRFI